MGSSFTDALGKNMNPPTFCITLQNHEYSTAMLSACLESARVHNWDVEPFWATLGTDLTDESWESIGVKPRLEKQTMPFPGVQGCFFSHFYLWQKCIELNTPIVVLEQDAVINAPWPTNLNPYAGIIKLHRPYTSKSSTYDEDSGNWTKSAHAYYLAPQYAKTLINWSRTHGAIPADVLIGDKVVPYTHLNYKLTNRNVERTSTTRTIGRDRSIT